MRHRNGALYLLDFGAVKQVTAASSTGGKSTGIYSMGFAPPEQMSGSTVYPSTDLYALAVTCITLLTGKDTGELYDSYNNTWNWQPHAQVNGAIAAILDRMLCATPNQRYDSAEAVLAALKAAVQSKPAAPVAAPAPIAPTPQPVSGASSAVTAQQAPSTPQGQQASSKSVAPSPPPPATGAPAAVLRGRSVYGV
jgi:serine/threonine protein kinase